MAVREDTIPTMSAELASVMPSLQTKLKSLRDSVVDIMIAKSSLQEGKTKESVIQEIDAVFAKFSSDESPTMQELKRSAGSQDTKKYVANYNNELSKVLQSSIEGIEGEELESIYKQILDAENILCMKERNPVITVTDDSGAVIGRSSPDGTFKVKRDDDWVECDSEDVMMDILIEYNKESKIYKRKEDPNIPFTKAQEQEWSAILSPNPPKWFNKLPKWEKTYLRDKLFDWSRLPEDTRPNLLSVIGTVPSTVRKFPGSANSYVTTFESYEVEADGEHYTKELLFEKVRSGVLIPFDVKDKAERKRLTKQNLEQLMADTIKRQLKTVESDGVVDIPMVIQTLFSPPIQPKNGDSALYDSVIELQKEFKKDEGAVLTRMGITVPRGVTLNLGTDYVNTPVNNLRGFVNFLNSVRNRSIASTSFLSKFKSLDPELSQEIIDSLRSRIWEEEGLLDGSFANKHNRNSERAALEQILNFTKGGNRIGSCVSGKDREEMVTEMAIAMMMYRDKYGMLPPPPGVESPERDIFENMVAAQFLSNHGQQIAEANSNGARGLKNVDEVYGLSICDKIRQKSKDQDAHPEFHVNGEWVDPILQTKALASYNKVKPKEPDDKSYKGPGKHLSSGKKFANGFKKFADGVGKFFKAITNPYLGAVLAVISFVLLPVFPPAIIPLITGLSICGFRFLKDGVLPAFSRRRNNALNYKDDIPKSLDGKLSDHDKDFSPGVSKDLSYDASPDAMEASPQIQRELSPELVGGISELEEDFRQASASNKDKPEDIENLQFSSHSAPAIQSSGPAVDDSAPAATASAPAKSSSAPAVSSHSAPATKPSTRRR